MEHRVAYFPTMLYIFDVDGTLTPQRSSSRHPFERHLLPGVAERCAELRREGHMLALATNQCGARQGREGRLSYGAVHAHLQWVAEQIGAETYRFATKPPRGKPSPAMLEELMDELGFTPAETVFVGDRPSDKGAAEAAGVTFKAATLFFWERSEVMGNYGPVGTDPKGKFDRRCQNCDQKFSTNSPRQKYCSNRCKRSAQNQRYHERRKERDGRYWR